ncbi:hypothetical protein [Candidatus Desulforudis audaxviator]|uniref:hypothetical protein n=1 Tax=Candidatus Desulforudis audaxviator TaxID=471827 RepID=UPI0005A0C863|nr:hypothetical protein [Candidatus Desulforudis audaxviator]
MRIQRDRLVIGFTAGVIAGITMPQTAFPGMGGTAFFMIIAEIDWADQKHNIVVAARKRHTRRAA